MPYYYVNKKAKLLLKDTKEEKLVRVRKVIKNSSDLIIEIAEKIDPSQAKKLGTRKKLKESTLKINWDELEVISYQSIKSINWTLNFIR